MRVIGASDARAEHPRERPTTPADLYRVNFELVAPDEAVLNQIVGEARAFAGSGGVPEFKIPADVKGHTETMSIEIPDIVPPPPYDDAAVKALPDDDLAAFVREIREVEAALGPRARTAAARCRDRVECTTSLVGRD